MANRGFSVLLAELEHALNVQFLRAPPQALATPI